MQSSIIRVCRLCLQPKALLASHVLPEFIYKPLYDNKHRMIPVIDVAGHMQRQKPMQQGVREPLLCLECEGHLNNSFERPNISLWRSMVTQQPVGNTTITALELEENITVLKFEGFDYSSFKLLLLSMLWRASVATHADYVVVDLGPHEELIRQMLYEKNPGSVDDYRCIVCIPKAPNFGLMAAPVKAQSNHGIDYRFLLPGVILGFVVANSASPYVTNLFPNGSLLAPLVAQDEAPFIQNLKSLVAQTWNTRRAPNRVKAPLFLGTSFPFLS